MSKDPILTRLRIFIRGGVFRYKLIVANLLYGAHIDKTVRISSSTIIDKNNTRGIYIGAYSYLAGGAIVFAHDYCR